jgi:hypothetical protein
MLKKFVFVLLMSGVTLFPKGTYAMDEEGASRTPISKPAPSAELTYEQNLLQMNQHIERNRGNCLLPLTCYLTPSEAERYLAEQEAKHKAWQLSEQGQKYYKEVAKEIYGDHVQ